MSRVVSRFRVFRFGIFRMFRIFRVGFIRFRLFRFMMFGFRMFRMFRFGIFRMYRMFRIFRGRLFAFSLIEVMVALLEAAGFFFLFGSFLFLLLTAIEWKRKREPR